jgi:hypothetical protein
MKTKGRNAVMLHSQTCSGIVRGAIKRSELMFKFEWEMVGQGTHSIFKSGIFELPGLLLHNAIQHHPLTLGFRITE